MFVIVSVNVNIILDRNQQISAEPTYWPIMDLIYHDCCKLHVLQLGVEHKNQSLFLILFNVYINIYRFHNNLS